MLVIAPLPARGAAAIGTGRVAAVEWRAQWIAAAGAGTRANTWHAFRRQLELQSPPTHAMARIAASDKYWLWVNGERVVFEGQLKRGPTREDTYYDTVDLAPYLRVGPNTIAVLVWYWGRSGYSHRSAGQPGLLFDADVDGVSLASDARWLARVLPAYGSTDDPPPAAALTERHIRYDARLEIPDWEKPEFDDGEWPGAVELGAPPAAPWNELLPRPVPQWRDLGLREYPAVQGMPSGHAGGEVVARLPYNAQVTPYLKVDASAGRTIRMHTDTYDTSEKVSLRAEYITRDGVQEYESYGWLSGHEVRYSIPPGVRVLELKYRETGYDTDFEGRFRSDDPRLNTLWEKSRRTLYVNMRDNHMDSPDRERAQWYGDMVVQLGQVFYALDAERGPLLVRKAWHQLAAWQREDQALVTPIPYGQGMNSPELPLQMLASVGWYGLWTYYLYTGDLETLSAVYPAVRDYLALWSMGADGLVVHRPGDWAWPDWGENADYTVLENAWYYLGLKGAVEIAGVVGAEGDVAEYTARMRSIERAFYPRFWQGDHFASRGHTGAIDDRSNALAVLAGLARPDDFPALLQVLGREEHASPYMEKYVLEALFVMNGAERAMERMKRRYRAQIDSWVTTLWEDWEWRPWNSYNHAWAGGPLTLLSQYAAGVAPAAPGWEEYSAFPRMGSLRRIEAVVPTPRGSIALSLQRDSTETRLILDAPGMPGTVGLLVNELVRLAVNGTEIWRDGSPTADSMAVRVISIGDRRVRLSVPAGAWTIEAVDARAGVLLGDEVFNLSENPIRSGRVVFNFSERPTVAAVFTVDGRRVVDLASRQTRPERVTWDLTNDRGVRVAPGVYLFVAKIGETVVRRRLIVPYGG